MFPNISIIIAVKSNNKFLEECLGKCLNLDYPFFEIIILPDDMIGVYSDIRIQIVPTGNILPAAKRDIGAENAKGEILAFLDDDTYPEPDWLKNAVLNFKDETIACVCGPAVTPENEPFLNKVSGRIYESLIISGPARFRYVALKKRFTDDFPSCNFFIRKEIFRKLGGFNTKFWPGEDTILCSDVVYELRKKIVYDPTVKVFHHRRSVFKSHLIQIANYALHRGYFVKRFPKTSLRIGYFLPSIIFFINLLSLILGLLKDTGFFYIVLFYLFVVVLFSANKSIKLWIYVFLGIILSHFTYGVNFIKGLFSPKLKEE